VVASIVAGAAPSETWIDGDGTAAVAAIVARVGVAVVPMVTVTLGTVDDDATVPGATSIPEPSVTVGTGTVVTPPIVTATIDSLMMTVGEGTEATASIVEGEAPSETCTEGDGNVVVHATKFGVTVTPLP